MKTCNKCKKEKELNGFYKCKKMKDGYFNKCKKCTCIDVTKNRNNNLERIREYDRSRGNRQTKEYLQDYRKNNPNKYKAHNMINNAIRDNKLFKEDCSSCGSDFSVEAHHDDYLKPLNIRWLCSACHKQWHRDNGEGLNG